MLSIGTFLLGGCVGGLIIYKIEEHNFKAMTEQCERLANEESALRREREEYTASSYVPKHAGTIDAIVDDKMKVLYELTVADNKNFESIKASLVSEIRKFPEADPQRIVDRVARTLICKKFDL